MLITQNCYLRFTENYSNRSVLICLADVLSNGAPKDPNDLTENPMNMKTDGILRDASGVEIEVVEDNQW